MEFHSHIALKSWKSFAGNLETKDRTIYVDGQSLDLSSVVAVSRYGNLVGVKPSILSRLNASRVALEDSMDQGLIIYGVNTGFGGSADTRTDQVEDLQSSLIRMLQFGILSPNGKDESGSARSQVNGYGRPNTENIKTILSNSFLSKNSIAEDCIPEPWIRASILIRINSLVHGCSAVRPIVVERLLDLLQKNIIPRIPLHGSISASGDLSPLSYIGGVIQAEPNLTVWVSEQGSGQRRVVSARTAFSEVNLEPIKLAAKEGLSIVNGTAVSAAAGALAMHDAHGLAVLSQALTAMGVEALCGTSESFDPFFAQVRPHSGQFESSYNIFKFLAGSKLVCHNDGSDVDSLRQDRYSIRTASQWIGPVLEDLSLAHGQITIECNSLTDNPLINPDGRILHGGNFQAKVVSSAMEKVRQGAQSLGRMLFVQCTELLNPTTNNGLPPNLAPDEPSQSFLLKGVDIMVAALQSELGFLAHPVNHVQTAEMGNQSLNSLALISARYTHTALDILSKLASAYLFAICQALDLRAMHVSFLEQLRPKFQDLVREMFQWMLVSTDRMQFDSLIEKLWQGMTKKLDKMTTLDSEHRFKEVVSSLQSLILESSDFADPAELIESIRAFTSRCPLVMHQTFLDNRKFYFKYADARPLLGPASKRLYAFVRDYLNVPFIATKDLQTPSEDANVGIEVPTIGSLITKIYTSLRDGSLYVPVMECLKEVINEQP